MEKWQFFPIRVFWQYLIDMRTTIFVGSLVCLLVLGSCTYLATDGSLNPAGVTVSDHRDYLELRPTSGSVATTGLIFVPGALVEPSAYVEALGQVSKAGYVVLIEKLPANLAVLNINGSLSLGALVTDVKRWVVAGHSLGGAMAGAAVAADPSAFVGIIFEAAYPPDSSSLAAWNGAVLSISADQDGLATPAKINATKYLLPATADFQVIAGACHAFFGSYGAQDGDGTPTITRANQQTQAAGLITAFLAARGGS